MRAAIIGPLELVMRVFVPAVLILMASTVLAADQVTVRFVVAPPARTDSNAHVYLAGNLDAVGQWKADGKAMSRQSDGSYLLEVSLPKGQRLEFKFTRSTWQTVEKGAAGEELANRVLDL